MRFYNYLSRLFFQTFIFSLQDNGGVSEVFTPAEKTTGTPEMEKYPVPDGINYADTEEYRACLKQCDYAEAGDTFTRQQALCLHTGLRKLAKTENPEDPEFQEFCSYINSEIARKGRENEQCKRLISEAQGKMKQLKGVSDTVKENTINQFESFLKQHPEYENLAYDKMLEKFFEQEYSEIDFKTITKKSNISDDDMLATLSKLKYEGALDDFPLEREELELYRESMQTGKEYVTKSESAPSLENAPETMKKVLQVASREVGKHEGNRETDKYFSEIGFPNLKTNTTPWCAGFVNWVLKQSGCPGTGSLAAKSFIKGTGKGHVGFKVGDKILGGNQGNSVCWKTINKPIVGYAIPTKGRLDIHKGTIDKQKVPDGAIIVYDRGKKDKNHA